MYRDWEPSSKLADGVQAYAQASGKTSAQPPALPLPPTLLGEPEYYNIVVLADHCDQPGSETVAW
jgi:hypothetical protein